MADERDPFLLIVDHTSRLRERLGERLHTIGFETRTVGSASTCLDEIERSPVNGIVATDSLPDLDGIRLLRSVRVTNPALPFVLVPRDGSESLASEAIAAGVSGYVSGDEPTAAIVTQIRECLRKSGRGDEGEPERYRHLVEASPVPINLFDETGKSIWCNQAVLDLLGIDDRDELIGRSIFEYIHPDDHDVAERELNTVTDEKRSVGPTRMRLRRADGDVRYILVSTAIGRFLGADIGQAVALDVTELRETKRELRDERRLVETALDSLDDLFYVLDADGTLLRWNASVSELSGLGEDRLQHRPVEAFFADEHRDRVLNSIETVIETGSDTVEAHVVDQDDRRIPYEFRGRRLDSEESDAPVKIVGVGRDVSDRKERERQLFVLERWLRHNIRNDLNVVRGLAELVRERADPGLASKALKIKQHADRLFEQADHQRRVVELVSNPSRPRPTAMHELVERQVAETRDRFPATDVAIDRIDDCKATVVPEIRFAVGELLENAIEHNDSEHPAVAIEVACGEDTVRVRVTDDGPGIPEDDLAELLFDREVDDLVHGSGLGLFLVYWAVRNSGGTVEFEENHPRGSAVTIAVPRAPAD